MPKLQETMAGGVHKKNYFQGTVCLRCVLAVLQTVQLGLIKVGNQAKTLRYSEYKVVFRTNLKWLYKITATDLDTLPTTTQEGLNL
jgi:hypothetical protein